MASAKTLTILGTQAVENTSGLVTTVLNAKADRAYTVATSWAGPTFSAGFGSNNKVHTKLTLFDKNGAIADVYQGSGARGLTIRANYDIDVSAKLVENDTDGLIWTIAPDLFSTGKCKIEMFGKVEQSGMSVEWGGLAYNVTTRGPGHYEVEIPFTCVVAV